MLNLKRGSSDVGFYVFGFFVLLFTIPFAILHREQEEQTTPYQTSLYCNELNEIAFDGYFDKGFPIQNNGDSMCRFVFHPVGEPTDFIDFDVTKYIDINKDVLSRIPTEQIISENQSHIDRIKEIVSSYKKQQVCDKKLSDLQLKNPTFIYNNKGLNEDGTCNITKSSEEKVLD